ncbi:hypothetical protein FA13DRAFT_1736759 [Coprinellus micaceus]|uniref:Uncharacterized protein n=1 Tax=Coprinellus micaceus TaxID=71717 RepID=A0A4Y7SZA7_COPMI|nr:hypothetical protein FA13DRAFT_1736759 [Coprinellus micaceus]
MEWWGSRRCSEEARESSPTLIDLPPKGVGGWWRRLVQIFPITILSLYPSWTLDHRRRYVPHKASPSYPTSSYGSASARSWRESSILEIRALDENS